MEGGFHSFLPAFRETEKEGGAEHSSGAGWFLVLKSLESKTLHGAWRFMCGGVGWGGVGGLLQIPAVPSSDTSLKSVKSWTGDCVCECMHVRVYVRNGACACAWT